MKNNQQQPKILNAQPVLAVNNIQETITYWQERLGFPEKWVWGDPPDHGAVLWNGTQIQFSLNPELAAVSKGNLVWIRVRELEKLYTFHQEKKADIISPLANQPWGLADYIVRDINGYYIKFSGLVSEREQSAENIPATVRIIPRVPTVAEFRNLTTSVGWSSSASDEVLQSLLTPVLFAVAAEDISTGKIIGCALILGDNASYYYIKDVMVDPEWQGKRVGTALMQELTNWLEANAAEGSLVSLITGENLAPFYQQFGFSEVFGMHRYIHRHPGNKDQ